MRTFEHPNRSSNWKCPICRTDKDMPVVLIGIVGTEKDNNMQAEQFHLACIDLLYDKFYNLIYQKIERIPDE